jgi:predicted ATPase
VVVNFQGFRGDLARELAAQLLALGEKQGAVVPLMIGHRIMGSTLTWIGDLVNAKAHYDQSLALYRPAEHRQLIGRFGQDTRVTCFSFRSMASWLLGYPELALDDADCAVTEARQIGQAATLMLALNFAALTNIYCGKYEAGNKLIEELIVLAEETRAPFRRAQGAFRHACVLILTGEVSKALGMLTSSVDLWRSTGSTIFTPEHNFVLASAYADIGQFDEAWHYIGAAITAMRETQERWCEAEVHRVAGEIALKSPQPNLAGAEEHFKRSLAVARAQQTKSWELRAAHSLARLMRSSGDETGALQLLEPVFHRFTEGFETADLIAAKNTIGELRWRVDSAYVAAS